MQEKAERLQSLGYPKEWAECDEEEILWRMTEQMIRKWGPAMFYEKAEEQWQRGKR